MSARRKNPVLWLAIGIPLLGVVMATITLTIAVATSGPNDVIATDDALSKTSWRARPSSAP